jgi:hypothetical protein
VVLTVDECFVIRRVLEMKCIPHVPSTLELLFRLRIKKKIFYSLGISVRDSKSKIEKLELVLVFSLCSYNFQIIPVSEEIIQQFLKY